VLSRPVPDQAMTCILCITCIPMICLKHLSGNHLHPKTAFAKKSLQMHKHPHFDLSKPLRRYADTLLSLLPIRNTPTPFRACSSHTSLFMSHLYYGPRKVPTNIPSAQLPESVKIRVDPWLIPFLLPVFLCPTFFCHLAFSTLVIGCGSQASDRQYSPEVTL
jgi:hypothetical protein